MATVLEWNCDNFTTYATNIYATVLSSPVVLPAVNQFYCSTANPRPGAITPGHLRVQYNSYDDWHGRITFETPTFKFRHFFATAYYSHSPTYLPYLNNRIPGANQSKAFILKTDSFLKNTYCQGVQGQSACPGVVIINMDGLQNNGVFEANITSVPVLSGGGYYRVDYEVMLNDPGLSNGLVRIYVNSTKIAEYLNVDMGAGPNENYSMVDIDFLGCEDGTFPMYRDMDRIWISSTAFDAGFGGGGGGIVAADAIAVGVGTATGRTAYRAGVIGNTAGVASVVGNGDIKPGSKVVIAVDGASSGLGIATGISGARVAVSGASAGVAAVQGIADVAGLLAEWPSTLPDALLVQGFALTLPMSSAVRTQMESGARNMRNRGAASTPVTGAIAITRAQLDIFDDFFVNQLLDGVLPFSWLDPFRRVPVAFRFANVPVYSPLSPNVWHVALELEVLP